MEEHDLCYASIGEIAAQLRSGRVSSVDITTLMLARIERHDPDLKSYAEVTADLALAEARRSDEERGHGQEMSPLHGVPLAVKDLLWVKGIPTAAGMPLRRDGRAVCDATIVQRLRDAGAVLLGTHTMTEGATFDYHPDMPQPVNPWRSDLWPGVSSSGSAVAVAAGLCFGAVGSDTGGSIRFPSACTGLTGLKPTWGRVSRFGAIDNAPTWDTLGPMARSAADAAVLFDAIAGHDPRDPTSLHRPAPHSHAGLCGAAGARGLRLGVDRAFMSGVSAEVARLTAHAEHVLSDLGAVVHEVAMADTAPLSDHIVDLQLAELAAVHEPTYPARADRYGPGLRAALDRGRAADARRLGHGIIERSRLCGTFGRIFEEVDMLLMPVLPDGAPTCDEAQAMVAAGTAELMRFTGFANACGVPSLTLPCGETPDGRPVGFQLIGPHGSEDTLLRAGHAYQQAMPWHARHPALH